MLDIDTLLGKMKKKRGFEADLRKKFIGFLSERSDLKVVGGKPVLDRNFYSDFIKKYKLDEKDEEKRYAKFFKKLKKHGIIHPRSALFPTKFSVVSINPNVISLHKVSLHHLGSYDAALQELLSNAEANREQAVYGFLRLFNPVPLYPNELKRIRRDGVIFTQESAYIYLERESIAISETTPYRLIPVKEEKSSMPCKHFV